MLTNVLEWFFSPDTLWIRMPVGLAVLAGLLVWDLRRSGRASKRLREYGFLLSMVAAAMAYGVINDQITSAISWQYFYMHDSRIAAAFGQCPPAPPRSLVAWEAFKLGMAATWWAGLFIGVAVLLANNPSRKGRPQLPYGRLYKIMLILVGMASGLAMVLGVVGWFWGEAIAARFFDVPPLMDWLQPPRFFCVYGIHLGGYFGGAVGLIVALVKIVRIRRLSQPPDATP